MLSIEREQSVFLEQSVLLNVELVPEQTVLLLVDGEPAGSLEQSVLLNTDLLPEQTVLLPVKAEQQGAQGRDMGPFTTTSTCENVEEGTPTTGSHQMILTEDMETHMVEGGVSRSRGREPNPAGERTPLIGAHARTPHIQRKRNRTRKLKYRWVSGDTDTGGAIGWKTTREPAICVVEDRSLDGRCKREDW